MRKYNSLRFKLSYVILLVLFLILVMFIFILLAADKKLEAIVTETAEQKTSEIIYKELNTYLSENNDFSDIIAISYDKSGNIIGLTTNSGRVNLINGELGTRLSDALKSLENGKSTFPAGALSGIDLLSGKGFDIDVSFHSITNITTNIVSTFEEQGINQTKHSLRLVISAKINAVMPGNNINITINQDFLISETVIVGKIPSVNLNND